MGGPGCSTCGVAVVVMCMGEAGTGVCVSMGQGHVWGCMGAPGACVG